MPKLSEVRATAPSGTLKLSQVQGPRADFSGVRVRTDTSAQPPRQRTIPEEIGRSFGLGGRSVIRGLYGLSGIVSDPLTQGINAISDALAPDQNLSGLITGQQPQGPIPRQATAREAADYLADQLGLPRPETGTERVAGGLTEALTGGGGFIGGGRALARQGADLAPTVASRVGELLSARPGAQTAGAALGSTASELTREAGGGPGAQAVAGAIGSVIPGAGAPAARRIAAPVQAPFQGVTQPGADAAVADILRRGATNTENLFREAPSAVPGVTRNLAEETLDPGIAGLQRQYGTGPLREQAQAANQARVEHLTEQFGGANPLSAQAFRDEADSLARQTSRQLRRSSGADIDNQQLVGLADTISSRTRRPEIIRAVDAAKRLMEQPFRNAEEAWDARKGIDDLIRGKVSDLPSSQLAQKQLLLLRGALDRQMRRAYPEWSRFLKNYQDFQRRANRVEVGETLLSRGGVSGLTAEGQATTALSPAKYRNLTDDLDQLTRVATGFNRARAASTLTDDQVRAIENVRDDLMRVAETQRSGIAGSTTAANIDTRELIDDAIQNRAREILNAVPIARGVSEALSNVAKRRIELKLQQVLANPAQARELLRNSTPQEQEVLKAAIGQIGATTSTLSGIQE